MLLGTESGECIKRDVGGYEVGRSDKEMVTAYRSYAECNEYM